VIALPWRQHLRGKRNEGDGARLATQKREKEKYRSEDRENE